MDGDEIFDDAIEKQWKSMILHGYTVEQINQARKRKKDKDDVRIYAYMLKQHAWENDISCNRVDVHLKLARALDAVCCRSDAIEMLQEASEDDHPFDSRICIALAKLLFRDDQKSLSLQICDRIIEEYRKTQFAQPQRESDNGGYISQEDVKKAFYLAGWIYIHDDYHTRAYEVWSEGHKSIPSCLILSKQHSKRECWDQDPSLLLQQWAQKVRCDHDYNADTSLYPTPPPSLCLFLFLFLSPISHFVYSSVSLLSKHFHFLFCVQTNGVSVSVLVYVYVSACCSLDFQVSF